MMMENLNQVLYNFWNHRTGLNCWSVDGELMRGLGCRVVTWTGMARYYAK